MHVETRDALHAIREASEKACQGDLTTSELRWYIETVSAHLRVMEEEVFLWVWEKDAPDHWLAESSEKANMRLCVWRSDTGDWIWEVFEMNLTPDSPSGSDTEATKKAAMAAAERFVEETL